MDENEEHEFEGLTIKIADARARARKHTRWSVLVLALNTAVAVLDAMVCAASDALKAAEQHRSHVEEESAFYDIVSTEEYEEEIEMDEDEDG